MTYNVLMGTLNRTHSLSHITSPNTYQLHFVFFTSWMIFCHPTKSVKAQIKENKLKIYTNEHETP